MSRVCRNLSLSSLAPAAQGAENRRKGRLRPKFLTCSLGAIADISASGARVAAKGKIQVSKGQELPVVLNTKHRPTIIPCRVVWVKDLSHWRHEIGLEFTQVSPETRESLNMIARECATQATFVSGE